MLLQKKKKRRKNQVNVQAAEEEIDKGNRKMAIGVEEVTIEIIKAKSLEGEATGRKKPIKEGEATEMEIANDHLGKTAIIMAIVETEEAKEGKEVATGETEEVLEEIEEMEVEIGKIEVKETFKTEVIEETVSVEEEEEEAGVDFTMEIETSTIRASSNQRWIKKRLTK
jgi:hypothetical protein